MQLKYIETGQKVENVCNKAMESIGTDLEKFDTMISDLEGIGTTKWKVMGHWCHVT